MKKLSGFSLFLAAILMSGCSSFKTSDTIERSDEQSVASTEDVNAKEEVIRSFDSDTLYDLMVAELGGQRKRYDLALGNYLKQAHKTQDKGVAKRAYQISQLIGARQASLDASLLWTKLAPDDAIALQASAVELVRSGRLDEAVGQMREVLVAKGEASFDFLAGSAMELTVEERQRLLESFDVVLKEFPANRALQLGKAILLFQNEDNEKAMILCDQLLSEDSGYVKAIVLKGRILNRTGRDVEAGKMLAEAVKEHPDRTSLRLLYARVLVHIRKLPEAREQFQVLLEHSPYDAEILLSLALIALENEMFDEASDYFKSLIRLGYQKSTASYYLGRIAEQRKDLETAREYFLQVMPGKEFMTSRVSLTQMLLKTGKVSEARTQLENDRHRFPVHGPQLYLLEVEVLTGLGNLDDALKIFNDAVVRYPKNISLLYGRAMLFEKLGRIGDLEGDLRKIIGMQPENATALNALGYTLADKTDRFSEAKKLIEQAYQIDSSDPAILDSMGWVQFRLGNYSNALVFLEKAYKKYPDPEVAAHLGEVLWSLGKRQEALAFIDEVLKEKPDSRILIDIRNRLKKAGFIKQEESVLSGD